jgi:predicted nuclease of predicted toxin-antitoxin system
MRVLLDENLPHKLRDLFNDNIEVVTVSYRGWKGVSNGKI